MKDRRQSLWESFPFFHLAEVPWSELGSLGMAAFTCRALLSGRFLNEQQSQGQGHFALWLGTEGSGKPGNSLSRGSNYYFQLAKQHQALRLRVLLTAHTQSRDTLAQQEKPGLACVAGSRGRTFSLPTTSSLRFDFRSLSSALQYLLRTPSPQVLSSLYITNG